MIFPSFFQFVFGLLLAATAGTVKPHAPNSPSPAKKPIQINHVSPGVIEYEQTYKSVGPHALKLYIYRPSTRQPGERRSAAVFFHGGGWSMGTPDQFDDQCEYLASRGMVAMTAQYRLVGHETETPLDCIADAKSAVRWIRSHCLELGVDPNRLAVGGGSAGGHLAACTATTEGFSDPKDDLKVSCIPNALILFNPALDLTALPHDHGFGESAKTASPLLNVRAGLPPTILFHGKADQLVPFEQSERFAQFMKENGNRCELNGYEGEGHGFFNRKRPPGSEGPSRFDETARAMDLFLSSLGFLQDKPSGAGSNPPSR